MARGFLKRAFQGVENIGRGAISELKYLSGRGNVGKAVGKAIPRVPDAIVNKTPGGSVFAKHAADLKAAMSYKKGGKVKKTGLAKVHKGERVLNVKQAKKFEKMKKQVFGIKNYGKNKS